MGDVEQVGGKNASLGEMISQLARRGDPRARRLCHHGVRLPRVPAHNGLAARIAERLAGSTSTTSPRWRRPAPRSAAGCRGAAAAGARRGDRGGVRHAAAGAPDATWAVRSSATAEDLPDASFAGQQETFLNISGLDNILHAIKEVFASLYNDRAISYRVHQGFAHEDVALSAGVQRMVRSDLGASGVMFTIDTESGFDQVVFITAAYGLGETVVQGAVNPDEFYV